MYVLTRDDRSGPRLRAETLIEEFIEFVQAETWPDSRRRLEQHLELLSDEGLTVVKSWAYSLDDEEIAWTYRYHYGLLEACRLMGVEAMFENFIPSSGPTEGVAAPQEFEDDLRRLAELDEAARRDPAVHRDRIEIMEGILRQLDESEKPSFRGAVLINLCQAYAQLPTGDPASNLRNAAASLTEAGQFFTQKTAPSEYAGSQNALGLSYMKLEVGDPTENLEKAIACFAEALRFTSPEYAPLDYGDVQNNLGRAYAMLATGDRVANLRRAIACFREALACTPEDAPSQRAIAQQNLTLATSELDRVLGGSPDAKDEDEQR